MEKLAIPPEASLPQSVFQAAAGHGCLYILKKKIKCLIIHIGDYISTVSWLTLVGSHPTKGDLRYRSKTQLIPHSAVLRQGDLCSSCYPWPGQTLTVQCLLMSWVGMSGAPVEGGGGEIKCWMLTQLVTLEVFIYRWALWLRLLYRGGRGICCISCTSMATCW